VWPFTHRYSVWRTCSGLDQKQQPPAWVWACCKKKRGRDGEKLFIFRHRRRKQRLPHSHFTRIHRRLKCVVILRPFCFCRSSMSRTGTRNRYQKGGIVSNLSAGMCAASGASPRPRNAVGLTSLETQENKKTALRMGETKDSALWGSIFGCDQLHRESRVVESTRDCFHQWTSISATCSIILENLTSSRRNP
jgi:hypothetical protein